MAASKDRWAGAWTAADVARLKALWNEGTKSMTIVRAFPQRTRASVFTKISKLCASGELQSRDRPGFQRTSRMDALFTKAVTNGIDIPALCDIFRRDMGSIYEWKRELGLTGTYAAPVPQTTKRDCLGWCGKKLDSTGEGHRFCAACRVKRDERCSSGDAPLPGTRLNGY